MRIIKKTIAALASAMMLASVMPVSSATATYYAEENGPIVGDVDGNRTVNNNDFTALKKFILGYSNSGATWESADLNDDDVVNSADLVTMMQILTLDLRYVGQGYSGNIVCDKYKFTFNGVNYTAQYTTNNWKIIDSYTIKEKNDMILICSLLKSRHAIPNKYYTGMRSAENMANEWDAHNYVHQEYGWLGSVVTDHTKDVDIDPSGDGMTKENWSQYF